MKKLLFVGVLAFFAFIPQISLAQAVNTYPNTAPEDAAKINDIQGQVNSSYFQNNALKQDATGVTQNSDGAANLLKNSNDSQSIKVTGPAPTEDNATKDKEIPVIGLVIFLLIMIAPIVLIINMLKNNKKITTEESISYIAASYSQEDEDLTEAQIKELELVDSEALGNEPKKITEEPVEKLKKEVKKKQSKKSKKKSKKKKKK